MFSEIFWGSFLLKVNVSFVMVMWNHESNSVVELKTIHVACYNFFICPLLSYLQIMESSKRVHIESGSTPHKPERKR